MSGPSVVTLGGAELLDGHAERVGGAALVERRAFEELVRDQARARA